MTTEIKCEWCGTVRPGPHVVAFPMWCDKCGGRTWHYRTDVFDELKQSDDLPAAVRRIRDRDDATAKAAKP